MSSSKNEGHVRDAGEAYRRHWTVNSAKQDTQEAISQRKDQAEEIGNTYYDLATLNYEYGWGRKFHFAPFQKGESIDAALAREEHFMALNLGLEPGMKVLDIGCGIGEPARSIARFAEVHVTGISTNRGHIARARKLTKEARMEGRVEFLLGDFCKMPFPDNSFDAVYAIESTCYAADLEDPFSEVRRVLKPGGKFGDYEFIMTEKYEKDNSTHEDVKFRIQRGTGCYTLRTPSDVSKALTTVGLEIVRSKDTCVVSDNNPVPWWEPINGNMKPFSLLKDRIKIFLMKEWVFRLNYTFLFLLSVVGLFDKERITAMDEVSMGVFGMREGGKLGIFAPEYLFVAKKPIAKESAKEWKL